MRYINTLMVTATISLTVFTANVFAKKNDIASQIQVCQSIKKDKKRLACFDKLASKLHQTSAKIQKPKSAINADKAFGLEQKIIKEQAGDKITARVVKITKYPYGQLKITLDNGQVWKQTASQRLKLKTGETVVINRGIMGSFRLQKPKSNRSYDVKRVK